MTDTSVADTTPPASAAAALTSPPPAPAFYEGFKDAGLKDWAGKNKFESPEAVAALAHKFDALKDKDPASLRVLPKADAKAEEHVALLREMGAPEDGAAYGLTEIEGVDKELATEAQGWFKEAGLLPWQARKIAEGQMAFMKAANEKIANEDLVAGENELAQLKTEWAGEYDAKLETGRRALRVAAQQAGVSEDDAKAFIAIAEQTTGTRAAMKIAAFFGSLIKEGEFVDGKGGGGEKPSLLKQLYPHGAMGPPKGA